MKYFLSFLLIFLLAYEKSGDIIGEYKNNFGSTLKLHSDSTFVYTVNYHMVGSWSRGTWKFNNDTIFFNAVVVLDTLKIEGKLDSLIVSVDEKIDIIKDLDDDILKLSSTHLQNRFPMDKKLYFKNRKLFAIDENGNLITKRQVFNGSKKYKPWYYKKE